MSYINKLVNHKKMNVTDVIEFFKSEISILGLSDVVKKITLSDITAYYPLTKELNISQDCVDGSLTYLSEYMNFFTIIRSANDLHNLYLIFVGFHELWHANQSKMIKNNKNDQHTNLIKLSKKLTNNVIYTFEHDMFYAEYDADIHAMISTLEFIKWFDFSKNAIVSINAFFASKLEAYYNSTTPIDNLIWLVETDKELKQLESTLDLVEETYNSRLNFINMYKESQKGNAPFDKMISGLEIPIRTKELLHFISMGFLPTTNIMTDIQKSIEEPNKRYIKC